LDVLSQLQQLPIECLEVEGVQPGVLKSQEHGVTTYGVSIPPSASYEPAEPTWLSALTGLKELRVQGAEGAGRQKGPAPDVPHLSTLTKLSWVGGNGQGLPAEVALLTQLRHLELESSSIGGQLSPLSSLTGITQLQVSLFSGSGVPEQLGSWMPRLEVLRLKVDSAGEALASLPADLTRLTKLEAPVTSSSQLRNQLRQYTTLVELELRMGCSSDLGGSCNGLTRLEVLRLVRASSAARPGWHSLQVGALRKLRSLCLCGGGGLGAALASATGCTQLTQLEADGPAMAQAEAAQLFGVGQLAQLQQLQVTYEMFPCPVQLGAWLGQQVQLTQLVLKGAARLAATAGLASTAALEQLPAGLCELHLPGLQKQDVPACLARLRQLQRLCLSAPESATAVQQLPAWLSQLQYLEWLDVSGTMVSTPQPVLGQLPLLRRVLLPPCGTAGVVLSYAPHLRPRMDAW
jgi:hypothetical protein